MMSLFMDTLFFTNCFLTVVHQDTHVDVIQILKQNDVYKISQMQTLHSLDNNLDAERYFNISNTLDSEKRLKIENVKTTMIFFIFTCHVRNDISFHLIFNRHYYNSLFEYSTFEKHSFVFIFYFLQINVKFSLVTNYFCEISIVNC